MSSNQMKQLPVNLLFPQRERLPDNLNSINWSVTPNTGPEDPDTRYLSVFGSTIRGFTILSDISIFVRITDGQNQIIPVSGWLQGYNYFPFTPVERELIGPPYVLTIQAYNTSGSLTNVNVVVVTGDKRETDINYLMLQELRLINSTMGNDGNKE